MVSGTLPTVIIFESVLVAEMLGFASGLRVVSDVYLVSFRSICPRQKPMGGQSDQISDWAAILRNSLIGNQFRFPGSGSGRACGSERRGSGAPRVCTPDVVV